MPRIISKTVYQIDEHPNKSAVFEWIRNNWYDLGYFALEDATESLKLFAKYIGATVDYRLYIVPDRGEFVSFKFSSVPSLGHVMTYLDLSGNCPFTGCSYDEVILDSFRVASSNATTDLEEVLRDVEYRVLKVMHLEGEYIYSDEGLFDCCDVNGYEFYESGEIA